MIASTPPLLGEAQVPLFEQEAPSGRCGGLITHWSQAIPALSCATSTTGGVLSYLNIQVSSIAGTVLGAGSGALGCVSCCIIGRFALDRMSVERLKKMNNEYAMAHKIIAEGQKKWLAYDENRAKDMDAKISEVSALNKQLGGITDQLSKAQQQYKHLDELMQSLNAITQKEDNNLGEKAGALKNVNEKLNQQLEVLKQEGRKLKDEDADAKKRNADFINIITAVQEIWRLGELSRKSEEATTNALTGDVQVLNASGAILEQERKKWQEERKQLEEERSKLEARLESERAVGRKEIEELRTLLLQH